MTRAFLSLGVVAIGCLLAGCQGQVSAELTTERPADGALRQVVASLAGLEFEKADGTTKQVAFTANKLVNLNGFQNGSLLSLLANESLPEGTYTGVRLVFDTDTAGRFVSDSLARRFSLQLAAGSYADFDFKVEKDKSSRAEIILTLDLRQSLRFEGATGLFTLAPYLRSVPTADASTITGTVSVTCDAGTSLASGGAVYLYRGVDLVPDDRDGSGIEPYATGVVTLNSVTGVYSYRVLDLPAGDYTVAATCDGLLENPVTDDVLVFRGIRNVKVARNDTLTADLAN